MKTFIYSIVIILSFYSPVSFSVTLDEEELKDISRSINVKFEDIENSCLAAAVEKLRYIEEKFKITGKLRSIRLHKKYLPIKRHYYLEVNGYILDDGSLQRIIF